MSALAARPSQLAGGFTRRGACPALSAPMQTGDGLLVRLNPVAGGLSPNALIGLCKAATDHGNGIIEVTARGSLQIRGMTPKSVGSIAAEVDALGIAVRTGVPVATGALAGLDPDEIADPTPLAERIRAGIEAAGLARQLGPKVSVVVDGGGRSGLDAVTADVRLTAMDQDAETVWQLAIAGDAPTASVLGICSADRAFDKTMAVLSGIAELGVTARARDLTGVQLSGIAAVGMGALPSERHGAGKSGCALDLLGVFPLVDARFALGVALPFGQTDAKQLKELAIQAQSLEVKDIRLAPKRAILALCPSQDAAEKLRETAEALGFVIADTDPRTTISACPGTPACASGYIPARKIAAEIANDYREVLDGTVHLHISGCAKGCAHPGKADLTLVGSENGAGIVVGGTARDMPLAYTDDAGNGLARLVKAVQAGKNECENSSLRLTELGATRLAEAFGRE